MKIKKTKQKRIKNEKSSLQCQETLQESLQELMRFLWGFVRTCWAEPELGKNHSTSINHQLEKSSNREDSKAEVEPPRACRQSWLLDRFYVVVFFLFFY